MPVTLPSLAQPVNSVGTKLHMGADTLAMAPIRWQKILSLLLSVHEPGSKDPAVH
jgi:hypothetical protein